MVTNRNLALIGMGVMTVFFVGPVALIWTSFFKPESVPLVVFFLIVFIIAIIREMFGKGPGTRGGITEPRTPAPSPGTTRYGRINQWLIKNGIHF